VKRQNETVAEMRDHRKTLLALEPELEIAIERETRHNTIQGRELSGLGEQKRADNKRTEVLLTRITEFEADTNKELAAGLITRKDATVQMASINQARKEHTDSKIGSVLLRDNILQKSTIDTRALDVLDRQAALQSQIAQLDITIAMAEQQSKTESANIARLTSATVGMMQTPYYIVKAAGINAAFAFVPYDNKKGVTAGAPVYDCFFKVLSCKVVGSIKRVFTTEERSAHPVFRTDLRGFVVQLNLEDQESAKSKFLFVGRKPLLF
jgi:hypothetical protein